VQNVREHKWLMTRSGALEVHEHEMYTVQDMHKVANDNGLRIAVRSVVNGLVWYISDP
jgi:hypothetical protein